MVMSESCFTCGELAFRMIGESGDVCDLTWRGELLLAGAATFGVRLAEGEAPAPQLVATAREETPGGWRVTLEYLLADAARAYRAWQVFEYAAGRVERRLRLRREHAGEAERLLAVTLTLDGPVAGDPAETRVSAPMMRVVPGTPWVEMARRPRIMAEESDAAGYDTLVSAPDILAGTVTLERAAPALHLAITPLPQECPATLRLYGVEGRFVIEQEFGCEAWLAPGTTVEAAQLLQVAATDWREALPAVGAELQQRGYTPPADRPAWARDAVIYEAEPFTCGGFRGLRDKLDALQQWGFNTLYLMPWHLGGYGTLDYEVPDPRLGTLDELRALCDDAHARGMHVLFDLLSNIANDGSPYLAAHPEWFYRDPAGAVVPHAVWKANCLDPAAPGFRQFMLDYTVRCCTAWGADGFRVDAVSYRGGPWWHLQPGLQPHQHAHAVFSLMAEIRAAIRRANPQAILLAETFGPAQVPCSDMVCWQWLVWMDWFLAHALDGSFSGAVLQRLVAEHLAVMPPDAWFTYYTHTHDTLAFLHRDLEGPAIAALFAALTLLGAGTMVFGGGWGMHARPRPEEVAEYQALFAEKGALGGVAGREVTFPAGEAPALFLARRPSAVGPVWVIANFSAAPCPLSVAGRVRYTRLGSAGDRIAPYDVVVVEG